MLKEQIKNCFDHAANTYDSVASIQKLSATRLVKLVNKDSFVSILDIGCGTGNTSLELYPKYPDAEYTFCDIAKNMLEIAAKKFPKPVKQICCDAEHYEFEQYYDLAISNLSMQWFTDIKAFIQKIRKRSRLFAFSTLLNTSFASYQKLFETPPTFKYPTTEEMLSITLQQYAIQRYTIEFENFFGVAKYFRKLGAHVKSHSNPPKLINKNTPIKLDYDIFLAVV